MSNFRRRLMMNFKKKYTPVEYLESTRTQYIDTGVKPNQNTSIEIKAMRLSSGISNPALFGVATPFFSIATAGKNLYYAFNNVGTAEISTTFDIDETAVFRNEKEKIYKNNTLVKTLASQENFQSSLNIILFGRNTNNGVERLGNFRIYYCKIFDGAQLIRNYIPMLDENSRPCLYDKVEDKFYYNEGSGEFLYE